MPSGKFNKSEFLNKYKSAANYNLFGKMGSRVGGGEGFFLCIFTYILQALKLLSPES